MSVVLFMYPKDIIMSDSKNAFYGKYSIHQSCFRPPDLFLLLSTLKQKRSSFFTFWAQQVIVTWRLLPEGDNLKNKKKPAVNFGVIL